MSIVGSGEEQNPVSVVVSCGALDGIGLELLFRAVREHRLPPRTHLYAPLPVVEAICQELSLPSSLLDTVKIIWEGEMPRFSRITPELSGKVSWESFRMAVNTVRRTGGILLTLPVSKDQWIQAGIPYAGHTEALRHLFPDTTLWMSILLWNSPAVWVVLATDHHPLRQAVEMLTPDRVLQALEVLTSACRIWHIAQGKNRIRLAVLGVNPHAGEGGLHQGEEPEQILPAIRRFRERISSRRLPPGMSVEVVGPVGADGFWGSSRWQEYDGILAMYHDQAFIPLKMYTRMKRGIHVTLGLPFWRLSPIHGTASPLRGTGQASAGSLYECLEFIAWCQKHMPVPPSSGSPVQEPQK